MLKQIQQRGLRYTVAIIFNRIVPEWLFRYRRFVVYQLKQVEAKNDKQDLTFLCAESIGDRRQVENDPLRQIEQLTGYEQKCDNEFAVGVNVEGKPVGAMWATSGVFLESELGVEIVLNKGQWWMFSAYVDKAFRRRQIYTQILDRIRAEATSRGSREHFVAVNPVNVASNNVHLKHALRTVGYVRAIRFFRTSICWTTGELSNDRMVALNSNAKPIQVRIKYRTQPRT